MDPTGLMKSGLLGIMLQISKGIKVKEEEGGWDNKGREQLDKAFKMFCTQYNDYAALADFDPYFARESPKAQSPRSNYNSDEDYDPFTDETKINPRRRRKGSGSASNTSRSRRDRDPPTPLSTRQRKGGASSTVRRSTAMPSSSSKSKTLGKRQRPNTDYVAGRPPKRARTTTTRRGRDFDGDIEMGNGELTFSRGHTPPLSSSTSLSTSHGTSATTSHFTSGFTTSQNSSISTSASMSPRGASSRISKSSKSKSKSKKKSRSKPTSYRPPNVPIADIESYILPYHLWPCARLVAAFKNKPNGQDFLTDETFGRRYAAATSMKTMSIVEVEEKLWRGAYLTVDDFTWDMRSIWNQLFAVEKDFTHPMFIAAKDLQTDFEKYSAVIPRVVCDVIPPNAKLNVTSEFHTRSMRQYLMGFGSEEDDVKMSMPKLPTRRKSMAARHKLSEADRVANRNKPLTEDELDEFWCMLELVRALDESILLKLLVLQTGLSRDKLVKQGGEKVAPSTASPAIQRRMLILLTAHKDRHVKKMRRLKGELKEIRMRYKKSKLQRLISGQHKQDVAPRRPTKSASSIPSRPVTTDYAANAAAARRAALMAGVTEVLPDEDSESEDDFYDIEASAVAPPKTAPSRISAAAAPPLPHSAPPQREPESHREKERRRAMEMSKPSLPPALRRKLGLKDPTPPPPPKPKPQSQPPPPKAVAPEVTQLLSGFGQATFAMATPSSIGSPSPSPIPFFSPQPPPLPPQPQPKRRSKPAIAPSRTERPSSPQQLYPSSIKPKAQPPPSKPKKAKSTKKTAKEKAVKPKAKPKPKTPSPPKKRKSQTSAMNAMMAAMKKRESRRNQQNSPVKHDAPVSVKKSVQQTPAGPTSRRGSRKPPPRSAPPGARRRKTTTDRPAAKPDRVKIDDEAMNNWADAFDDDENVMGEENAVSRPPLAPKSRPKTMAKNTSVSPPTAPVNGNDNGNANGTARAGSVGSSSRSTTLTPQRNSSSPNALHSSSNNLAGVAEIDDEIMW